MSHYYNNTDVCSGCPNNPAENPLASGVCHCVLPYITPTEPVRDTRYFFQYTTDNTIIWSDPNDPLKW